MLTEQRYISIDGYLLQRLEDGVYRIVNFKYVQGRMSRVEREQFNDASLIDLDSLASAENDIIDCSSKHLFDLVQAEEVEFYYSGDHNLVAKVVQSRTSKAMKTSSFREYVLPIVFATNVRKFLRYVPESPTYRFILPEEDCYVIPERINLSCYKVLQIQNLNFNLEDCRIMWFFHLNRGYFNNLAVQVLQRCYDSASSTAKHSFVKRCFSSFFNGESLIRTFKASTITQYGQLLAPQLYLLLRLDKLSMFSNYRMHLAKQNLGWIDTERLKRELEDKSGAGIRVTYLSEVCISMLKEEGAAGAVLDILLRSCALNFGKVGVGAVWDDEDDDDDDAEKQSPIVGVTEHAFIKGLNTPQAASLIRKSLDAFKALLTFGSLCTPMNQNIFADESCASGWSWVKSVYQTVAKEAENFARHDLSLVGSQEGVLVRGKLFSRGYIRAFYKECKDAFDSLWDSLDEYFFMVSVENIARDILRNREVTLQERRRGLENGAKSLLDLIPSKFRNILLPKIRREKYKHTEAINTIVSRKVDEMGELLMWMVYFGAGFPFRFPELQLLSYAGPQRNVYVDEESRRIQLFCDYNKNCSSQPYLKTLDRITSDYLFYYVIVLRQMQMNAVGPNYAAFNAAQWMHVQNVFQKDASAELVSRNVLATYLFLNTSKGCLATYRSFETYLKGFPAGFVQKLSFRELRQAMIAIIRFYVGGSFQCDFLESMVNELMANHSVMTGMTTYGVDNFSLSSVSGQTAVVLQERASERWIRWLDLEGAGIHQASAASPRVADPVMFEKPLAAPRNSDDLLAAGRKLLGPQFQFRDCDQQRLCLDIYMGDERSLAIQAAAGYGKTELYHIPLVALAMQEEHKFVSFVFVPYTVLLASTMSRLSFGGHLKVAQVGQFMGAGHDGITDVYVGVFEDLANSKFATRIAGWKIAYSSDLATRKVSLGYIVIDEFHNFETEKYRRFKFDKIGDVIFDMFRKAVFISGTAPRALTDASLKKLKFQGLVAETRTFNEIQAKIRASEMTKCPTRMVDLVRTNPLNHVKMYFKTAKDSSREAAIHLKALFEVSPHAKAIVILNSIDRIIDLAFQWEPYFKVVWVHGKLSHAEKIARTQKFMSDSSTRVLLGTKLVSEGIDIKGLKMVLLLDFMPNVLEFVQAAGRLRAPGICCLLAKKHRPERSECDLVRPLKVSCLKKQVAEFYGLKSEDNDVGLPPETQQLMVAVEDAIATLEKQNDETLFPRKRGWTEYFINGEKSRLRKKFHGEEGYTNIFRFLDIPQLFSQRLHLYGIDIYFCPEGVFTEIGSCKGCQKAHPLCVCQRRSFSSYRQMAWEALAVKRMLLDNSQFEAYLHKIEPFHKDPVGYLELFASERKTLHTQILRRYRWLVDLLAPAKCIRVSDCLRGLESSSIFTWTSLEMTAEYNRLWSYLQRETVDVLEYFLWWERRSSPRIWDLEEAGSIPDILAKRGTFARMRVETAASLQGPEYLKVQFNSKDMQALKKGFEHIREAYYQSLPDWDKYLMMQLGLFFNETFRGKLEFLVDEISSVHLFPQWLKLNTVEIEMADKRRVPFYVFTAVLHYQMRAEVADYAHVEREVKCEEKHVECITLDDDV